MKIALLASLIYIGCAVYSQPIVPESTVDVEVLSEMTMDELLQIKVTTGTFLNTDFKNSSAAITIITAKQLEASGARHLSEALEIFVPGFQMMINKWNGIIWGMRGVASDRNTKFIFLVNGHKMNTESRDGAMTELDIGLMDDIERIEVLRGPAGLTYGSGAIAGVINVVTKTAEGNTAHVSTKLQTWRMQTFGEELQMSFSDKIEKNIGLRFDFGIRQSDGVGFEKSRILGRGSWPLDGVDPSPPHNGVPTLGSAGSTPGNYKIGLGFEYNRFNLYTRWTRQVTNGSGWYPLDPWPEFVGVPDQTMSDRIVDGVPVSWDSYFAGSESWGNSRRQYVVGNISTLAEYGISVGEGALKIKGGFDALSNKILLEQVRGFEAADAETRGSEVFEAFGERRYNLGAMYTMFNKSKYKLAAGYDFFLYDIGENIAGANSQQDQPKHSIVSDVVYVNNAFYAEGKYSFNETIETQLGLRYDLHTRTKIHGGVFSPKLGIMCNVNDKHSLKLFYQQSANNGSADNYEFNRYLIGDDGVPFDGEDYHFNEPNHPSDIIPPVTEEMLHQLKPERSRSIELSGGSQISDELFISPAFSYNTISDLFAWNQDLYRVVNTGKYSFVNFDFDIRYISAKFNMGANHTYQRIVNMNLKAQEEQVTKPIFDGYDSTAVGSTWHYMPKHAKTVDGADSTVTVTYNYIRDGVTVDAKNFVNLSPHVTKFYVNYKPLGWFTLHFSSRIFWGMKGRADIHEFEVGKNEILDEFEGLLRYAKEYNYLDVHKKPMVKMNTGLVFGRNNGRMSFAFHIYDMLAGNGKKLSINSLRWNQMYHSISITDLYAVDYTSYAVKFVYKF